MSDTQLAVRSIDINELKTTAQLLAVSGYFDAKGNNDTAIAQIATKILAGREMGYGPFTSVNNIHIIQGRPSVSANLMASAVKSSGRYDYRVTKMDADVVSIDFYAIVSGKRELLGNSTFTKEDAKNAGTQNMAKYARNMLFARAMSNGVKWFCPDVFNGNTVYVPEELGADVDGDGNVIDAPRTVNQVTGEVTYEPAQPVETTNGNGNGKPAKSTWQRALEALNIKGQELFEQHEWDGDNGARHYFVHLYTKNFTPTNLRTSSKELTEDELVALRKQLTEKAAYYQDLWAKRKAKILAERAESERVAAELKASIVDNPFDSEPAQIPA